MPYIPLASRDASPTAQIGQYIPLAARGTDGGTAPASGDYVPLADRVADVGKKFIAEGIPGLASDKPAPKTWLGAAQAGVADRTQSLKDAFSLDVRHPEKSGLPKTVMGMAGLTAPVAVGGPLSEVSAGLIDKVLQEHLTSSEQILENVPEADLAEMGGMPALLDRTRTNIADALKAYQLPEVSDTVRSMDLSKFSTIQDLGEAVAEKLHAHLGAPIESAAEVAGQGGKKAATFALGGLGTLATALGRNRDVVDKMLGVTHYSRDEYLKEHPEIQQANKIVEAIGENETSIISGDKKYSFNKPSGSKAAGRDLGRYQVTEAELKSFGKQFLGKDVTPEEFLASPEMQNEYIQSKVEFLQKEGLTPEQIIAVHAQGMTGWGDQKVLAKKIADANKYRKDYVSRGMEIVNSKNEGE